MSISRGALSGSGAVSGKEVRGKIGVDEKQAG